MNFSQTNDQADIVIVDDTPANLTLLSALLSQQGYKVRPCPSGQFALAAITRSMPDLILLDIQMPQMDGYQVCQQLKSDEATSHIPVIFISALSETLDKVKAFGVGGVDYITKPFQTEEVLARVSTHLQLSLLQKMLQQENDFQAQQLILQNQQLQQMNQQLKQMNQKLKQKYKQLQQTQLQLVQSEKMATLGQLVAGVAHEINNPVGFIAGNLNHALQYLEDLFYHLELYQKSYPEPAEDIVEHAEEIDLNFLLEDFSKLIHSMKVGTDCILNISVSLRNFSRAETIDWVNTNLHEGIESTLLILKHRLKSNDFRPDIEVIKNYGNLPEIECLPGQINQVFINIIANSIDALDELSQNYAQEQRDHPQSQITITTEVLENKKYVAIRIKDNGIGMSEAVQQKIFEHLFTTKEIGKGTGLGLSISHQIVEEKHGGTLSCISTLGEGTEFIIQLPIVVSSNP